MTTAPARDRRLVSRNALSDSPIRVPPSQSKTSADARRSASSGSIARERPRQARQARAEAVGLPARVGPQRGMREDEQRAGVGRHRAGDVEEEHEPPPLAACAPARRARSARRRCETSGGSCAAGPGAPDRARWRRRERRVGTASLTLSISSREQRELLLGAAREALVLQHLDRAREQELGLDVLLALRPFLRLAPRSGSEARRRPRGLHGVRRDLAEERAEDSVVDRDVARDGRRACHARPSRDPPAAAAPPRGRSR